MEEGGDICIKMIIPLIYRPLYLRLKKIQNVNISVYAPDSGISSVQYIKPRLLVLVDLIVPDLATPTSQNDNSRAFPMVDSVAL